MSPLAEGNRRTIELNDASSSFLVRDRFPVTTKKSDSQPESFLPNIKPLKPPGFSLQTKEQKNPERLNKATIQRSLITKYNQELLVKKPSQPLQAHEIIFQQIQVRQLLGNNEDQWQKPLTKVILESKASFSQGVKNTNQKEKNNGQQLPFQSLMSPSYHSQLQKFVMESNSIKNPPLLNLEELLSPTQNYPPIRHHVGISTATSVKLTHNRNVSHRFSNLVGKTNLSSNTYDSQRKALKTTQPITIVNLNTTESLSYPIQESLELKEEVTQDEDLITKELPIISQNASQRNLDGLTFKKKQNNRSKLLSTQASQSYLAPSKHLKEDHPLWRHQSLLFCQSLKLEPVKSFKKKESPVKKSEVEDDIKKHKKVSHKNSMQVVSKRLKMELMYTSIDPVTDRKYLNLSRRLKFNRKFERSHLPLLILRYSGLLGKYIKDSLTQESQSLMIRSNLGKFMQNMHSMFQIVVILETEQTSEKTRIIRKHLELTISNQCNWFFDGAYLAVQQITFEQIILDFEVNKSREDIFILESIESSEINAQDPQVQKSIATLIDSEFEITRILVPDLLFSQDSPGYDLLSISESIIQQFQGPKNRGDGLTYYTLAEHSELQVLRLPLQPLFHPHLPQPLKETSSLAYDAFTLSKLSQQNMGISIQIAKYKQKYAERQQMRDQNLKERLANQINQEKQIINLVLPQTALSHKRYQGVEKYCTITGKNEEIAEIYRDILKKKYRQL